MELVEAPNSQPKQLSETHFQEISPRQSMHNHVYVSNMLLENKIDRRKLVADPTFFRSLISPTTVPGFFGDPSRVEASMICDPDVGPQTSKVVDAKKGGTGYHC